ncbi:hypothetical protein ACOMHN_062888 [Nucella lapillus]
MHRRFQIHNRKTRLKMGREVSKPGSKEKPTHGESFPWKPESISCERQPGGLNQVMGNNPSTTSGNCRLFSIRHLINQEKASGSSHDNANLPTALRNNTDFSNKRPHINFSDIPTKYTDLSKTFEKNLPFSNTSKKLPSLATTTTTSGSDVTLSNHVTRKSLPQKASRHESCHSAGFYPARKNTPTVLIAMTVLTTIAGLLTPTLACYKFPPGKRNPCEGKQCNYGATCQPSLDGNEARCQCPRKCYRYGDNVGSKPVCGSDGHDYANLCEMKMAACNNLTDIRVKYYGKCGRGGGEEKEEDKEEEEKRRRRRGEEEEKRRRRGGEEEEKRRRGGREEEEKRRRRRGEEEEKRRRRGGEEEKRRRRGGEEEEKRRRRGGEEEEKRRRRGGEEEERRRRRGGEEEEKRRRRGGEEEEKRRRGGGEEEEKRRREGGEEEEKRRRIGGEEEDKRRRRGGEEEEKRRRRGGEEEERRRRRGGEEEEKRRRRGGGGGEEEEKRRRRGVEEDQKNRKKKTGSACRN